MRTTPAPPSASTTTFLLNAVSVSTSRRGRRGAVRDAPVEDDVAVPRRRQRLHEAPEAPQALTATLNPTDAVALPRGGGGVGGGGEGDAAVDDDASPPNGASASTRRCSAPGRCLRREQRRRGDRGRRGDMDATKHAATRRRQRPHDAAEAPQRRRRTRCRRRGRGERRPRGGREDVQTRPPIHRSVDLTHARAVL